MIGPASRRGILRGLAGVSTIGGTVALPALVQTEPVQVGELLQLGVDLDRALGQYVDLVADKERRVTAYHRIKPALPESIIKPQRRYTVSDAYQPSEFYGEFPPNHDGAPCGKASEHRIRILWPYEAEKKAQEFSDLRTRWGKRYRFLRDESAAYFDAHEKAREAVDLPKVEEARFYKGRDVLDLAFRIMAVHATSLKGLAIKGRAGFAMDTVWQADSPRQMEDSYRRLLTNLVALGGVQS